MTPAPERVAPARESDFSLAFSSRPSLREVLVVGSLNMDLTVVVDRLPSAGATVLGSGFRTSPGGKGANQAVAARQAGAPTRLLGRTGQDSYGEELRRSLMKRGLSIETVFQDPDAPTGIALITVEASGQNTIVVVPGANARLSPSDIESALPWFERAGIVVLQQEIPLATVEKAVAQAASLGVPVLLNPAPARSSPLPRRLLEQVTYLVPNETEAALMSGLDALEDDRSVREAAQRLQEQGARTVIITLGSRGAFLRDGADEAWLACFPVKSVDTTGAGDAFIGGLAAELVRGVSLIEALRFASACGALATTRWGAQEALPTEAEVRSFLQGLETATGEITRSTSEQKR